MLARFPRTGELLSESEFCARLGWTERMLQRALAAGSVFFVETMGERLYPAFFAESRFVRRKLYAVARELGDLPGGAKLLFMTTRKASLAGKTPLETLLAGGLARVKASARAFAQQ